MTAGSAPATAADRDLPADEGDPASDPRAFRRCLGHFATGVTVITATSGGTKAGVTANSFSSVSLDPPLVSWSIARTASSRPVFAAADGFAINILAADQIALASRFARSGGDKFAGLDIDDSHGVPLLKGAAARIVCTCETEYEGGDHIIMVGRVTHYERYDRAPLLFVQGRFGLIADHPEAITDEALPPPAGGQHTLFTLFRLAYLGRAAAFQAEAAEVGLSVTESRILYHVAARGPTTIEAIADGAVLDRRQSRDVADALMGRGLLAAAGGTIALTDEGRAVSERLSRIAGRAEAEAVSHLPAEDVEAARRVLAAFLAPTAP